MLFMRTSNLIHQQLLLYITGLIPNDVQEIAEKHPD